RDAATLHNVVERPRQLTHATLEDGCQPFADLLTGQREFVFVRLIENADLEQLAAVGCAISAPGLLQVIVLAPGLRRLRKFDEPALVLFQDFLRSLAAGDAAPAALPVGNQRIKRFCSADETLPGLGVGAADLLRVGPAEPSVESIVPQPQRHVADTGKEGLVKA